MLRAHRISSYIQYAQQRGIDVSPVFIGTDLTVEGIKEPGTILSFPEANRLIKNLDQITDESFALECGSQTKHINMGIVGHAMLSCTSMAQASKMWVKYAEVIGHPLAFNTAVTNDEWVLEFYPRFTMDPSVMQFCLEDAIASLFPLMEETMSMPFRPSYLELTLPKPANYALYERYVFAPLKFNARRNCFIASKHLLDIEIKQSDREVLSLFDNYCSTILRDIHRNAPVAQRVRSFLLNCRGNIPGEEQVAERLGVSRRTFVRRLHAEGYTYRGLIQDFRKEFAFELLHENVLQTKEIAHCLGYRDVGSFRRSFKEWTGLTVRQWCAKHLIASQKQA